MIQDFFIVQYSKAAERGQGILVSLFYKLFRALLKLLVAIVLPLYFRINQSKYRVKGEGEGIIISLTTFPARLDSLWIVLESLLRQRLPADRIVVWLSKEQIHDYTCLPKKLQLYSERGVEFRFEEEDIRSYKKFYYAFKEFSESLIITVDDDIIYDSLLVEELVKKYKVTSGKRVIARYGTIVTKDDSGNLKKYVDWRTIDDISKDEDFFFGSGGGTLFNPNYMYKDVCRKDLFLSLCPNADDVWLNAMCRLEGVRIVMCNNIAVFPISIRDNVELSALNVNESLNDKQIAAINEYYKEIKRIVF